MEGCQELVLGHVPHPQRKTPPPLGILRTPQPLLATCLNALLVPAPLVSWSEVGVLGPLGPQLPPRDERSCCLHGPAPKEATCEFTGCTEGPGTTLRPVKSKGQRQRRQNPLGTLRQSGEHAKSRLLPPGCMFESAVGWAQKQGDKTPVARAPACPERRCCGWMASPGLAHPTKPILKRPAILADQGPQQSFSRGNMALGCRQALSGGRRQNSLS